MINIKKIVLLVALSFAGMVHADEPSVYGAGNIESANPYGLTQTEKTVLENKRTIQMLYNKINEQQRKVDGLSSIIEGQNKEILQLKEQLTFQLKSSKEESAKVASDANKSYGLLLELAGVIDEIKNSYVTHDDLEKSLQAQQKSFQAQQNSFSQNSNSYNENVTPSTNDTNSYTEEGISTDINYADRYREGVQLFYNHSYQEAKEHFEEVLAANYKAAPSNFYLGEIAYYTYQYADAVAYYKQSALLYDSASYMDVLYLHTAISLEKSGDASQAKGIYEYVISTYPDKKSASIARNRLSQ